MLKAPAILLAATVQRSEVERECLEPSWESET